MKSASIATVLALMLAAVSRADGPGWSLTLGYKNLSISDERFSHDTHPDDSFLPNADVPGSAGDTKIGGLIHFASLGVRYETPVFGQQPLTLYGELGGLVGFSRDDHKNANDPRPDANASFVYSKAQWGLYLAGGLTWDIGRFYVGGEAQANGVFVDSGWDRFGKDESDYTKFIIVPSVGPKVGYRFTDHLAVEGTVQFGRAVSGGIQVVYKL